MIDLDTVECFRSTQIELAAWCVRRCRIKLEYWTRRYAEAQEKLRRALVAPRRRGGRRSHALPIGESEFVVRYVYEQGSVELVRLAKHVAITVYGEDTRKNRKRFYSRLDWWRRKGWLVRSASGKYSVPKRVADKLWIG